MSLDDPVILTCAISGVMANRAQCPAIPYTPEDYAAEARRIVDEGGVQIHIHARTPDGRPSFEVEDYRAISDAIIAEVGDRVIINFSTGATAPVALQKRIAYLRECRPEVAALNLGTTNYGKFSAKRNEFVFKFVFENKFEDIIEMVAAMGELGIRPECECLDLGFVGTLGPLMQMGLIEQPLVASLVVGVVGGAPATVRNIQAMVDNLPGGEAGASRWQVIGISRDQWRIQAAALTMGGSVRVGLEDNFYLPDGTMARSNGDLVAKARQLTEELGRRSATVEEAREMLVCRPRAART
jgi:3-keto-5-aminohexanoate cleavage enzyme